MTTPRLNSIIIEDDPVSLTLLENMVSSSDKLNHIGSFVNPVEAIKSPHFQQAQVLFLDIQTSIMDGFEFIKTYQPNQQIIITTSNREYALQGFEHGVIDFILKPISLQRFNTAINKLNFKNGKQIIHDFLFVKVNKEYVKIKLDDILWIDACSEYIDIQTKQKNYLVYSNMEDILKKLDQNFIRIHRSHIIALDKVEKYAKNYVVVNGKTISVSRTYAQDLIEKLGIE